MVKESSKEISCPQFNNYIILSELSNPPTLTVMPPWKKEYIDLLRRNIEEYRNIDFIDNRGDVARKDVTESSRRKISVEKKEGGKYVKKSFFKVKKFIILKSIKTLVASPKPFHSSFFTSRE